MPASTARTSQNSPSPPAPCAGPAMASTCARPASRSAASSSASMPPRSPVIRALAMAPSLPGSAARMRARHVVAQRFHAARQPLARSRRLRQRRGVPARHRQSPPRRCRAKKAARPKSLSPGAAGRAAASAGRSVDTPSPACKPSPPCAPMIAHPRRRIAAKPPERTWSSTTRTSARRRIERLPPGRSDAVTIGLGSTGAATRSSRNLAAAKPSASAASSASASRGQRAAGKTSRKRRPAQQRGNAHADQSGGSTGSAK